MTCWMRPSWMVMPSASCYAAVLDGSILQAPLKRSTSLPLRTLRFPSLANLATCSTGWGVCWSWLWVLWIWAMPRPTGQSKQLCYTFLNCCRERRPRSLGRVSRLRRDNGGNCNSCLQQKPRKVTRRNESHQMKQWKISKKRPILQGCHTKIGRRPLMGCFAHPSASGACQQSTRPLSKLSCWNAPTAWNVSALTGSGSIPDMEKDTPWFRIMATESVGRCCGRDVLGYLWMALTLVWTSLHILIFALTIANGRSALSVAVVAFAITSAGGTDVQHARRNPRPDMQGEMEFHGHTEFLNGRMMRNAAWTDLFLW